MAAVAAASVAAASPTEVRWFVAGGVLTPRQQQYLTQNASAIVDGVLPCCNWLDVGTNGSLTVISPSLQSPTSVFTPLVRAGKGIVLDLGGTALCCPHNDTCHMWEQRQPLAEDLLELALTQQLSGYTLDWEFPESFNWTGFNATMAHVGAVLAPHGIGLEVCINTEVEKRAWAGGGDPSGNTYYRWMPWATKLTNMGTYELCHPNINCTDDDRKRNVTTLASTVDSLVHLGNYSVDVISPGIWLAECSPLPGSNETATHGWTQPALRAFLEAIHAKGVRSIDVWCGVGVGLPVPCPTCPWAFDVLAWWKTL